MKENAGTVSFPSNDSHTVQVPITINEVAVDNTTYITVCPISNHNVACKTILLNSNVCETNPNYYFSDMSSCPELIYGDINQDMIVDILDIIIMIDIIMGNIEAEDYMIILADINQDNIVDIMDIINIINIILS